MRKGEYLSQNIKAEAFRLGFYACGFAHAEAVEKETADNFKRWLNEGRQAEMHYMQNHEEKRMDPRLLMPGVKTIVSVALNYTPSSRIPSDQYQIAAYAYGHDYHNIVRNRLHQLAAFIYGLSEKERNQQPIKEDTVLYRAFSDSAPVLERYWAVKAGLGWIGKNHLLIIPGIGSQFFLGELFLSHEVDKYDVPQQNHCGNCHRCLDACPTGALSADDNQKVLPFPIFDSFKCLSYQTIENRGEISEEASKKMGNYIYGCDRCQQACPWNNEAKPTVDPLLMPKKELLQMTREQWLQLSEEDYRKLFKESAVKRAKYNGLMRNIQTVASHENAEKTSAASDKEIENKTQ